MVTLRPALLGHLGRLLFVVVFSLLSARGFAASAANWQLPSGARTYKETSAIFVPGGERLNVIFWFEAMKSAGVSIFAPDGHEVASTCMNLQHGLGDPTGLYQLKGDQSTQVVLFGRVGAKAAWGRVYSLESGGLRHLFDWSGWSFQIVTRRRTTLIATKDLSHGVVTDLRRWRDEGFVKVNELFPEFYVDDVQEQEKFIREAHGPFASNFAEACRVVAQELLYSRKYMEARGQCQQALVAIRSRCCSGASFVPRNVSSDDKKTAEEQIRNTIGQIETALKAGSTALSK
jgi:hypothetical protein